MQKERITIYVGNRATMKANDLAEAKSWIRKSVATPDGVPPKVESNCIRNPPWLDSIVSASLCGCPRKGSYLRWDTNRRSGFYTQNRKKTIRYGGSYLQQGKASPRIPRAKADRFIRVQAEETLRG
jgi:hypothetical protein